jgi:hypothetical protein
MIVNAVYDPIEERVGEGTLNKISKLLTLADSGANENEANTAMSAAMKLLAKHNLTASDIESWTLREEEIMSEGVENGNRFNTWKSRLFNVVAETHFCYLYRASREGKYVLTGTETNRRAVVILMAYLEAVIEDCTRQALKEYTGWEHGKTYANSFRLGMVSRIAERLREEQRKIIKEAEGPGSDIVVANPYEVSKTRNVNFVKSNGVRLIKTPSRSSVGSGAGYRKGTEQGDKVGLTAGRALTR